MKFRKILFTTVIIVSIFFNSYLVFADSFVQQELSKVEIIDKEVKVFHYLKGPEGRKVMENTLSLSINVRNGTDGIISKLDFDVLLSTSGTSKSWLSSIFTEDLTGGLKPGEETECYISTDRLVEKNWKEKYSKISTLNIVIKMIYGAKGQPLSSKEAILQNHKFKSIGSNVIVNMIKEYSTILLVAIPVIILPLAAWIITFLPKPTRDIAIKFFFSAAGLFMFIASLAFPDTPHIGGMVFGLCGFILFLWSGYKEKKNQGIVAK